MRQDHPPPYRAPTWLPGGHLQTVYPLLIEPDDHPYRRERWETPDGDFIDLDWNIHAPLAADPAPATASSTRGARPTDSPVLILFHGLEGSSGSPYARALMHALTTAGWGGGVVHFRGCSGEANRLPRAYHSGDSAEVDWILRRVRATHPGRPLYAVGVSLGGNALMRWAEESGDLAARTARAVAAVSSPLDLTAGGLAIGRGFNRLVYTRMFLRTMKPKALAKWRQHPGLFDRDRLLRSRTLYEFDDLFTAPLHGFRDTDDYWQRASAKPQLRRVRIPALLLNARNDPFVPAASLPGGADVASCVRLWQPPHGGHVGFAQGPFPARLSVLPEAVTRWMRELE